MIYMAKKEQSVIDLLDGIKPEEKSAKKSYGSHHIWFLQDDARGYPKTTMLRKGDWELITMAFGTSDTEMIARIVGRLAISILDEKLEKKVITQAQYNRVKDNRDRILSLISGQ
jgi:hypothetical protein